MTAPPTGRPLLEELSAFAQARDFAGLPQPVVASVCLRVLDTLGIALAARATGLADGAIDLVALTAGRDEASIVGASGARFPAAQAAFVDGILAHSLDFDDTHLPSVLHPSASIIPTVLAVAESTDASGQDLVAAAAVGIELTVRLGMGGYLTDDTNAFFERGWHATSICGTLGCAAAAGRLYGLGASGILHAMAIAASMGAGILEANRSGGTVKRLHCGWAAHAGITAAQLAARGFTGPSTALEGRFGFFQAYLDGHYNPEAIVAGLGQDWELPGIFFKPYPANHYTHAGIDAALAFRRKHPLDIGRIVRIELGSSAPALRTIGEPRAAKLAPQSGYHAQFSGPFTVAAALLAEGDGLGVWFNDFTDERAHDPLRLALAGKVETFVDPACDELFPRQFAGVLRIHLDDGTVHEERVMSNRGGPENPLSTSELRQKFAQNAGRQIAASQADRLADLVLGLPSLGSDAARRLMELAQ